MDYVGLAISDSMFPTAATITRVPLAGIEARMELEKVGNQFVSCCNPSHVASLSALKAQYQINVQAPEAPQKVELKVGDRFLCLGISGLPRLTDRHEYTKEEVVKASFRFAMYLISAYPVPSRHFGSEEQDRLPLSAANQAEVAYRSRQAEMDRE